MNGYILLGITGEGKSPEIRKFSRFKIVPIFIISSKSTEVRSGSMVQFSYYGSCLVLWQLFLFCLAQPSPPIFITMYALSWE